MIPTDHLAKALREADRLQILDVSGIERVLARVRHRTGVGHQRMQEALARYATIAHNDTRSPLEDDFLRLVHEAQLPPPQTNVDINGLVVDAAWPTQRLVVELDGFAYHRNRHAFERDRERDAALTAAGWRVVRFTYDAIVRRPDRTIGTLRRLGLR